MAASKTTPAQYAKKKKVSNAQNLQTQATVMNGMSKRVGAAKKAKK